MPPEPLLRTIRPIGAIPGGTGGDPPPDPVPPAPLFTMLDVSQLAREGNPSGPSSLPPGNATPPGPSRSRDTSTEELIKSAASAKSSRLPASSCDGRGVGTGPSSKISGGSAGAASSASGLSVPRSLATASAQASTRGAKSWRTRPRRSRMGARGRRRSAEGTTAVAPAADHGSPGPGRSVASMGATDSAMEMTVWTVWRSSGSR
mmetsp:Transcript_14439/g.31693  ORF Transcript_14439/g.31693 Transcript_14439/m.31693 type:complete len:205 (-) Transcript_14439:2553-3167(-)